MKKIKLILLIIFLMVSCSQQDDVRPNQNNDEWTIPKDEVFDGGPGKDGIPALLNPEMIEASFASYIPDEALVIGYKNGNDIRAYPHLILDWHEIVNDEVGGDPIAITYCPLTGTGIGWEREIDGQVTTFGVSGLLYNSNLIPYDRLTDSNWSQMLLESVNGDMAENKIETFQVIETSWKTWKQWFPKTLVNSTNTGFTRNYGVYPYGDYKTNQNLIFPVANEDARLHAKERVLGIISGDEVKAYRFEDFAGQAKLIKDKINDREIIVAGSEEDNYLFAYYSETEDGQQINLSLEMTNEAPLLKDDNGNTWNLFGKAIAGPLMGNKLKRIQSYIGFWFAWAAFYPQIEIYEDTE